MFNKKIIFFLLILATTLFGIFCCYADEWTETPDFITQPCIDKKNLRAISLYRSLVGRPYPKYNINGGLNCQSNKHYFLVNGTPKVFAPCDGIIHAIDEESPMEFNINIIPHSNNLYIVTISNINISQSLSEGDEIKAGSYLGTISNTKKVFSIMVLNTNTKTHSSVFCHMTENILEYYGIDDVTSIVISQDLRDKFPSYCKNTEDYLSKTSIHNGPKNWFIIPKDTYKNILLNFLKQLFSPKRH